MIDVLDLYIHNYRARPELCARRMPFYRRQQFGGMASHKQTSAGVYSASVCLTADMLCYGTATLDSLAVEDLYSGVAGMG